MKKRILKENMIIQQRIFKLLFVLILNLGFNTEGHSQCNCTNCLCTDSLELVKLYNATNGASWKTKWTLVNPVANWYGITLANGRVTEIRLASNKIYGTLPNLNITNLKQLWLLDNQLSDTIPNFNLPNLEILHLEGNQLSGRIPDFKMPNLVNLSLSGNQLSGNIPNFNLPNLSDLHLQINKLSGVIPNFNLPNLIRLYLSQNQLNGIIPNINLPKLQTLDMSSNQLSGSIPNFNLPNLQELWLFGNQLSGSIPNFILPKLYSLWLYSNQLTGCIPKEIKIKCPLIGELGGKISDNVKLSTQIWANYWNNGEGICTPSSLKTIIENTWYIHPNPAHNNLFIEGVDEKIAFTIYSLTGNLMLNVFQNEKSIDISSLGSGIYVIRILSTKNDFTRFFVKKD
jgi:phage tail tube protein FII